MSDFMDLETHVQDWAWQIFDSTKSKEQAKINKDNILMDISWSRAHFKHGEAEFGDKRSPPEPKGQVIFTTTFINDTDEEHEYSFKTERTTKSTCEIEMSKGVTTGAHVELTLKTPCEVFEANAGFSREVAVSKTEGETIEEELVWSVDSQIKLPPQTKTQAKLVVNQQEYGSKFKVSTKLWGKVIVTLLNRADNNNYLKTIEGRLDELLRGKPGFTVDKKVVNFVSEGKCHFRYGIDQQVKLEQKSLQGS